MFDIFTVNYGLKTVVCELSVVVHCMFDPLRLPLSYLL